MAQSGKLRIFLCHSSEDKSVVRELYGRLKESGFEPWLDEEDLLPGQKWQLEIPRAVREADVVLVCLSQTSITKQGYIQKEIKFALDAADERPDGAVYLIPARLSDCPIPERLRDWQWVNLFQESGYRRLLKSLQAIGGSEKAAEDNAPGLVGDLFPLYGVTLGKTTVKEMEALGGKRTSTVDDDTRQPNRFYGLSGTDFWFDDSDIFTSVFLTRYDNIPEKWKALGFLWQNSYSEWLAALTKLGFAAKETEAPLLVKENGKITLKGEVIATKTRGIPLGVELDFRNRAAESIDSPGTLFSLHVSALNPSSIRLGIPPED